MKRSETQSEILKALAQFHKNIIQPKKDANNPFFKSKYVPLENVTEVIDKVAPEYGLAYAQEALTDADKGMVGVTTLLTHESGEWIEFEPLFLKADKQTAQGYGSAITYARRYALSSAFGIASETDDDGNETTTQTANAQKSFNDERGQFMNRIQSVANAKGGNPDKTYSYILKQLNSNEITPQNINKANEILKQVEQMEG
ncbi:ERF family protein [Aerococcus urinaeequi]|uniref:ERF family protein n=1 Tax=Aerococcus urinaeequi TaxID=51665 RepID=UPI003D6AE08C